MPEVDAAQVRAILVSPVAREATAAGDAGRVVRAVRKGLGWSQQHLARVAGYSQASISRLENRQTRVVTDLEVLHDVAVALQIPTGVLGLPESTDPNDDDVKRRDFLAGAIAVSAMALLPRAINQSGRIGEADIRQAWAALHRLYEIDDSVGGAVGYPLASDLASRLVKAVNSASFSSSTENQLHALTACAMEHAGWVAYDGGQVEDARRWWLETTHLSELSGVVEPQVSALTNMSLQASNSPARAKETFGLVQAARRVAGEQASPTLLSLLSAREAVAHAQIGDREASRLSLSMARGWLDRGRDGTEPVTLNFWGPADLACHETRVALLRGDGQAAEASARTALRSVDRATFPRNHAIYSVRLAQVLTIRRRFDEAVGVTADAIEHVDTVRGSKRAIQDLRRTLERLAIRGHKPAVDFASAAKRVIAQ